MADKAAALRSICPPPSSMLPTNLSWCFYFPRKNEPQGWLRQTQLDIGNISKYLTIYFAGNMPLFLERHAANGEGPLVAEEMGT